MARPVFVIVTTGHFCDLVPDDWAGTKIELFVSREIVKGKMTDCVRIRRPATAAKAKPKKSDEPKPDYNDEVKF